MTQSLRRPRAAVPIVASLAAALVALTGCTPAGNNTKETPSAPTVVASLQPASEGDVPVLRWALPNGEPSSLDPINAVSYSNLGVVSQMCDTLLRLGSDMSYQDNLVAAEQVDPLTIRLKLKAKATFWDGTPVTVEDVAYSLERSKDPKSAVSFLFANVNSIQPLDQETVEIKFSAPDALFMQELASPAAFVVKKQYAVDKGDAFGTAAGGVMCSGPFKFDSWKAGSGISLTRNDSYWDPKYKARALGVEFSFLTDSAALTQAINAGEIDGAYEVPPTLIPALQNGGKGSVNFGPSTQSFSLAVSHPGGVIGNVDLRKALFKSFDREAISKSVFYGAASPNYTAVASQTWDKGAEEVWQSAYKKWEQAGSYDLNEAKSLVQKSGYKGEELVMSTLAGNATQSKVAQLIQQQAKQVGINIRINNVQPSEYALMAYDSSARQGTDLYVSSSFNGSPGTLEYLQFVLADKGAYNYSEFNNQEAFAAVKEASGTFDLAKRTELLVKAQDAYEAEYGSSSILNLYEVSFLSSNLTGATTSFAYLFTPSLALIGKK